MAVSNKAELKQYVLRALGAPLIEVDITDDAFDDRVYEALDFFREYYYDGADRFYHRHIITQEDANNGYITMPDYIWGVNSIFPVTNSTSTSPNIFDLQYQFRQWDMSNITSTSLVYYTQVMQHLDLLDNLLNVEKQFRFNRNIGKLFIDTNWTIKLVPDTWLLIDCYAAIDPNDSTKFWNNRQFKEYVIALVKKQWSRAYSKYNRIQLPGGVEIDGKAMYEEAVQECTEIEQNMINNGAPLQFFMA